VPAVPEAIAQLVERMMEKDAGQRIASAPQLLDAMRRQLAGAAAGPATPVKGGPALPRAVATAGPVGDKTVKLKKTNKILVVAAVTVIVWSLLGVGYLLYTKNQARNVEEAKRKVVIDDFFAARRLFDTARLGKGDWDQVTAAFTSVLAKHDDYLQMAVPVEDDLRKPLEQAVEGFRFFCQGKKAFDTRDFPKAIELLKKAEDTGAVKAATTAALISEAVSYQAVDEVEKFILKAVEQENWFVANNLWAKNRAAAIAGLPAAERERWDDLKRKIDQLRQAAEARKILAEAEKIAETDPEAAIEMLDQYMAKTRDNPNRLVEAYLRTLRGSVEYANARTRGKSAEDRSEYDLAITSYEKAMTLNEKQGEKDGLPTKVHKLKGRVWFEKGKQALTDNNTELALECFQKTLLEDADNEEAKKEIAKVGAGEKIKSLRRLAVTSFETKEYEKAITIWKQLRDEYSVDPVETGAEITRSEFQIALRNMEAAWVSGDDAQTLKAIEAVLALDPAHERALLLKTLIEKRRQIRTLIANGNALRDKVEYGDAKLEIRRAIDIAKGISDAAIREQLLGAANKALDEVEYIDCFTKAKRDLDLDKLQTAVAWAKGALRAKSTPEAKALLSTIEAAIAKKPANP
jgi:tetratricopeptide (TPR) repeat protein